MDSIIPQDDTPQKQCSWCKKFWPATAKFFYRRENGLRNACIACENPTRKPPKEPVPEGMKRCSQCPNIYPATHEFFNKKRGKLRAECKTCQRASGKIYDDAHVEDKKRYGQEHKEERRAYGQFYEATHREEISRRRKQWHQLHREERYEYEKRYREAHSDYRREYNKRYREEHHEQIQRVKKAHYAHYHKTQRGQIVARIHWHRRRMREKAIKGVLTAQQIQDKLRLQHFKCYYCHARFEKKDGNYVYHLEHTIPISRTEHNPRHDINYVVLSCSPCNLKKWNRLPHEWPEGGRLL